MAFRVVPPPPIAAARLGATARSSARPTRRSPGCSPTRACKRGPPANRRPQDRRLAGTRLDPTPRCNLRNERSLVRKTRSSLLGPVSGLSDNGTMVGVKGTAMERMASTGFN